MDKPLILVTNDDGMFAPGIKALVEVAKKFGKVLVVAPDSAQSGQGHAITITKPLRVYKVDLFEDVEAYECSGTPVDCVKLAKHVIAKEPIQLCLSGINHGLNSSINVIYSGTMSAAMEASLEGINSIGFSLDDYGFQANFTAARMVVNDILTKIIPNNFPLESRLLNVNIPRLAYNQIKGIKICRQGKGRWDEDFQKGNDPRNQPYFWLTGKFIATEKEEGSDLWALENHYVSVVPTTFDLTDYKAINSYKFLEK